VIFSEIKYLKLSQMENKRSGLPQSNALRTNASAVANQQSKVRPAH